MVLAAAMVFPEADSVAAISSGYGTVTVYALDGPLHEGDPANVTGDGSGSIIGITYGGFQNLGVVSQARAPLPSAIREKLPHPAPRTATTRIP